MKVAPNFSRLLFACLVSTAFLPQRSIAADAFIDRDGRTFTVSIDGTETTRTPARDIKDVTSVAPYTVHWSAHVEKGPKCFRITPKDPRLGEPEKIDLLIHEIQADKPFNSWRSYNTVPSTEEKMSAFLSGDGFCASEYTLTDRLRFTSLPAGEYVVMISFWGKGNWDRQSIVLRVDKSGEQVADATANEPSTAEASSPSECTLEYAAKRTMALHQQLEDKVAKGEVTSDVFRSFGKDTEDFGELYTSNIAEVCRRLQLMKNKYKLK